MIDHPDGNASKGQVLLVDDERSISDLPYMVLEDEGYEVTAAANGLEALTIFHRVVRPFDLLVTDCQMPGMGGFELARACSRRTPELAVLYMSGSYADEELRANLATGRRGFLAKPFSGAELLRRTKQLLALCFCRSCVSCSTRASATDSEVRGAGPE
jgi:two-component system OmpR family response regulator